MDTQTQLEPSVTQPIYDEVRRLLDHATLATRTQC